MAIIGPLTSSHSSVNWGLIDVMSSIVDDLLFYLLLYYNYLLNLSSLPFVFMFFIEWIADCTQTLKLLAPQGWPMVVFPTFSTLKIVWPKPENYGASSWNYLALSNWKLSPGLWKYSPRLWKCWHPNSENAGTQILKMLTSPSVFPGSYTVFPLLLVFWVRRCRGKYQLIFTCFCY